jgi:two-component system nitrate/nitrite response regulator NarL
MAGGTAARPLRVAVGAADALARAGLEALLEEHGFQIAGDDEADAIVTDAGTYSRFGGAAEAARVVAVAVDSAEAQAAWRAGAAGVVYRTVSGPELAAVVTAVAAGAVALQPEVAADLRPEATGEPPEGLTPREAEVLALLARGNSNREIARALGIRESTVKFHVNAVMAKLGAGSRTEAVVVAARAGLVAL